MATTAYREGRNQASKPQTAPVGNVVPVADWAATTAGARENAFKMYREIAEASRLASVAMVGGFADYTNEIHDIGLIWTKLIAGILDEGTQALTTGSVPSDQTGARTSEVLRLSQRIVEANLRLMKCHVNVTSEACKTFPTCEATFLSPG